MIPRSSACDRLSAVDSLFLYLERPETPINIGCVAIFDGQIAFNDLVRFVETRLPLIPRYRQRVAVSPLNISHPRWEYTPQFDIKQHVKYAQLKDGTEEELQALAGQIFSAVMDRSLPLWDMTLVDGLRKGSAVIIRTHHCLADGISGVSLISALLDASPQMPVLKKPKPFKAPPPLDEEASLVDALFSSYADLLDKVITFQTTALNLALNTVGGGMAAVNELMKVILEYLKPVERLPFNQPCIAPRKVAWTKLPMADVNAVRESAGATVNDFVLTVIATALGRYSEMHGVSVRNHELRVFVPVNLRRPEEKGNAMGNRISIMPVNIPLGIGDPIKLMATIHQRTEALKRTHIAEFIYLAGTCLGMIPTCLQALSGSLSPLVTFPIFNLVCTNIPGPKGPLYMLGRRMLTYYPHVPIGNDWGIGCAVLSYDGELFFGFTADSVALSDIAAVARLLESTFSELSEVAVRKSAEGVAAQAPPKSAPERKPRKPRARAEGPLSPVVEPTPSGSVQEIPTIAPETVALADPSPRKRSRARVRKSPLNEPAAIAEVDPVPVIPPVVQEDPAIAPATPAKRTRKASVSAPTPEIIPAPGIQPGADSVQSLEANTAGIPEIEDEPAETAAVASQRAAAANIP